MSEYQKYTYVFEHIDQYFLILHSEHSNVKPVHKGTKYTLFAKIPLGWALVYIDGEDKDWVISKLLETNIEIRDELPYQDKTFEELLEVMWMDEKSDYVLVGKPPDDCYIYNKVLRKIVDIRNISSEKYLEIRTNMLNAGVEIWDKSPDAE